MMIERYNAKKGDELWAWIILNNYTLVPRFVRFLYLLPYKGFAYENIVDPGLIQESFSEAIFAPTREELIQDAIGKTEEKLKNLELELSALKQMLHQ